MAMHDHILKVRRDRRTDVREEVIIKMLLHLKTLGCTYKNQRERKGIRNGE